jgi:ABC-type transport system involved in multi-copper enzyme maturation permease subunit
MNARLIKETRALLPIFACMLPLIVVPQLIWPPAGFGVLALGVACVVMAGSSFGTEFQHRTISLLLSQPIPRSVIWREKMLVLGAGMVTSLIALLVCLVVSSPVSGRVEWLTLALIPLCAFCGAPYWTLSLRQSIAGMVAAVGAPCGVLAVYGLTVELSGGREPAALVTVVLSLLFIYCAVVCWLGYAKFKRLEAVDIPTRELGLPAGLEAILVAPLTRMSSRFPGPFATLLKKEFRLQQIGLLLAGVFILIAVAGFCLAKRHPEVATGIVAGDIAIYALILPLIAGAISVAEERGWGIAEWHLTLPPSTLKQWSAKMLATLSTSLILGLVLPTAVALVADLVFSQPGARTSFPPAFAILSWVLGQMLVTSVAVYTASFAKNTLQAILAALVILIASGGALLLASYWVHHVARAPVPWVGQFPGDEWLLSPLLSGALAFVLCLFQWFAWSNFRRFGLPARRLIVQFTVTLLAVWLIAWVFFSALFPPTWRPDGF